MSELLARLKIEGEGRVAEAAIAGVDQKLAAMNQTVGKAEGAQRELAAALELTEQELRELQALQKDGTISAGELAGATRVLHARLDDLRGGQSKMVGAMRLTGAGA